MTSNTQNSLREAADYVERLEVLAAERGKLCDALRTQRDEIEAERAKLAEAYSNMVGAPGTVRGPVFEQVKAQILDTVEKRISSIGVFAALDDNIEVVRDQKGRVWARETPMHPRYVVQQVNGFGPNVGQRQTWYKIVDTAHPIGRRDFKRVGVAYDATDARHIAEMFEARST